MYLLLRMVLFYCYISLPEGIMFDRVKINCIHLPQQSRWHNFHIDYDHLRIGKRAIYSEHDVYMYDATKPAFTR